MKDALDNEDFKRVQASGPPNSSGIVPTIQTPSHAIQPLLSGIVRPANSVTSHVGAGSSERHSSMEPGGDICSMRIISRPR